MRLSSCVGEESRLAVAHGEQQRVADVTVVLEEEEPDRAVRDMPDDPDLEAQGLSGSGRAGRGTSLAAEQAIDPLAPVVQVGAEPADQQQVGLPGLDDQAGGHPAGGVEIPGRRGARRSRSR